MSTSFSSTPGSPATARPCTRAGCPARDGSSWSRRSRSAAARSPCTIGARADGYAARMSQLRKSSLSEPDCPHVHVDLLVHLHERNGFAPPGLSAVSDEDPQLRV